MSAKIIMGVFPPAPPSAAHLPDNVLPLPARIEHRLAQCDDIEGASVAEFFGKVPLRDGGEIQIRACAGEVELFILRVGDGPLARLAEADAYTLASRLIDARAAAMKQRREDQ